MNKEIGFDNLGTDDLLALRRANERLITLAIGENNQINVLLNRRLGSVALPEFGNPLVSREPEPVFEHDPFGDLPCQDQLPDFPKGA